MADKEARVRLTLNNSGFLGGLRQTTDEVRRQGEAMAHAFHKPLLGGLDSAKKSLTSLGSEAKNAAKFGLALGGSFALGAAAKSAFGLRHEVSNLAFAIRAGTGEAVNLDALGAKLEVTANNWSQANRDVVDSYRSIYEQIGDAQFASGVIDAVGEAATASGKSMGVFANIASDTFKFFNVGAKDMRQALAAVISFGEQGGLTIEEIAGTIGQMGASAKLAGASGMEGLSRVLGMANMADSSLGKLKEKIGAVKGLFDRLNNPDEAKRIGKEIHAQLTDKNGNVRSDALNILISKTGGNTQKLNALFGTGSKEAKLLAQFGDLYKKGADDSGLKGAKRTEAGLAALNAAIEKAAQSNLSSEAMREEATRKAQSSETAMQRSMNALEQAFNQPKMAEAMNKLAQVMPKLASGVAKLLETVAEHPLLAGGAVIGAKIGAGAAEGIGASIAQSLGRKIASEIMAQKITVVAKPIVDGLGMVIGKEFVTVAAAATPWQNAGKLAGAAMGIAVGAYLVEKFGEWIIDKANEQKADTQRTAAVGVAVSGTGDKTQITPALKRAREALRVAEAEARATSRMGMGGGMGMGASAYSGEVIETTEVKAAREAVRELEAALAKTSNGGDKVTRSLDNLGNAIDGAAQKLNKLGTGSGGDGSNGPPNSPGNAPGYGG